jgi:two-component system, sensor histidine kinase and response regulator
LPTTPDYLSSGSAQELIRYVRDAVIITDAQFIVRVWNDAAENLYGWKASEVVGRNGVTLLQTEFPGCDKAERLRAIAETGYFRGECVQACKDGTRVHVEADSTVLKNDQGETTGYLSVNRDITERKQTEAVIAEQKQFLSVLTDSLPGPVGFWNQDQRCGFANQAYREWFGIEPKELIGLHMSDLLGEEVHRKNLPFVLGALRGQGCRFERTIIGKGGRERHCQVEYVPHRQNGEVLGFFVLAFDVTQQKRTEEQLRLAKDAAENANQAKGEFLATMSHEIRTPMNGVLGMVHALADTPLNTSQSDLVNTLRESGDHLLCIINDILDFTKIEAGRLDVALSACNALSITDEAIETFKHQALSKKLTLAWKEKPALPVAVFADRDRLKQVLLNLVGNAIKFTEAGGITIGISASRGKVRIEVNDTGVGIAPGKKNLIFERFSQADASSTRRFGGTGLGLAISKRLIELMGGSIGFDSVPGKGSTFWCELPASSQAAIPETSSWVPVSPAKAIGPMRIQDPADTQTKPLRVLLAEDNAVNQKVAVLMLRKLGCAVEIACDGHEAVALAKSRPFDLVLMDCQMPHLDGFAATQAIREWESQQADQTPGRRLLVVALTAGAMHDERASCFAVGMDGFMAKPIKPQELAEWVKTCLGSSARPSSSVEG